MADSSSSPTRGRIIQPERIAPFPRTRVQGLTWKPHEDVYHFVLTIPWWQFVVFLLAGFLFMNAVFALLYRLDPGCITGVDDYEHAFFFSVQTLGTIGYGSMAPATHYGHIIVSIEAFFGMLTVAMITGITFAKFSRPTSKVLFSNKIVIHERDGKPYLVFRLANQRHNLVVEATLRVMLLVFHQTKEGEQMRRALEVPLVKQSTGLFTLTWIPMHLIDETSPFYGPDAKERLANQRAELFLGFQGYDETLAQSVHARWRYSLDDIVWNARYEDMLTIDEDGTRNLDYTKFHSVLPVNPKDDKA